jgi:hypothetical protein
MAADDVVRGAAKARSFLSGILGVADEAITPGARKAVKDLFKDNLWQENMPMVDNYLDADETVVLKRLASYAKEYRRGQPRDWALLSIAGPSGQSRAKLMYNYQGLGDRARTRILSELSKSQERLQLSKDLAGADNQTDAMLALGSRFPKFQRTIFSDELATEFGADSAAEGLFESFVDDGMSPVDARDAVRALLGGQ